MDQVVEVTAPPRPFAKTRASGPIPAKIMCIGEAPGASEEVAGVPFVGSSGDELDRMLKEIGLLPAELEGRALRQVRDQRFFLTNVCKYRPPENKIENFFLDSKQTKPNELIVEGLGELQKEIAQVQPELIIAFGNTALWALTSKRGITKWRGSMLDYTYTSANGVNRRALLLPTYHPALILREWSWRSITIHDLRRAHAALQVGAWPHRERKFLLRPSFSQALDCLRWLKNEADKTYDKLHIASDLETRGGYIACHALAWSESEAISIPNMCVERPSGFYTLDQDLEIWAAEKALLTHPRVSVVGQNYLYDAQYFARRRGYVPRLRHDTLFMQHIAFPGLPKGLDFLSSMYRQHHIYWKDEGKEWNTSIPEEQYWAYNCEDAIATFEVRRVLKEALLKMNLWEQYRFQMRLWDGVLEVMLRGVLIDQRARAKVAEQLLMVATEKEQRLRAILGQELNTRSPKQIHHLFYEQLKCKRVYDRKTKQPTCNEDAMLEFVRAEPLLKVITQPIIDLRSIGVMMGNIVQARLDDDGRMRSSFTPTAETLRWTSSKNAWQGGTNLQNWTKGDEDKEAAAVEGFPVPNARKLIIPDNGCEIGSVDLTGADAQTVAWESDDADLKRVFRENKIKIHAHNAKSMFPGKAITGYEQPYYDLARTGVHLVNYVGGVDTLAGAMGISRWEAQSFMSQWFSLHPGILDWHDRIQDQLSRTRSVSNKFGYRIIYFDRIEGLLPEAVAWIGQSTTACVTNRAFVQARDSKVLKKLGFQLLFQVHDELVFQYPIRYRNEVLSELYPLIHITVPYDDPLVIPWGLKVSVKSWGECEKHDWPR